MTQHILQNRDFSSQPLDLKSPREYCSLLYSYLPKCVQFTLGISFGGYKHSKSDIYVRNSWFTLQIFIIPSPKIFLMQETKVTYTFPSTNYIFEKFDYHVIKLYCTLCLYFFLKMGQTRPLFGIFSFFFTTQGQI